MITIATMITPNNTPITMPATAPPLSPDWLFDGGLLKASATRDVNKLYLLRRTTECYLINYLVNY